MLDGGNCIVALVSRGWVMGREAADLCQLRLSKLSVKVSEGEYGSRGTLLTAL
jgi:hypothetical protein